MLLTARPVPAPTTDHWLKTLIAGWLHQLFWLIEYEPTWFSEYGFGIGLIGWGLICVYSPDYKAHGTALALPIAAILLGIIRCVVVVRLWYAARVILTSISLWFWSCVFWALVGHYGLVSQEGLLIGVFVIELLTAIKFSIPCVRELLQDR